MNIFELLDVYKRQSYEPTPFEERLVEVEVSFGECLANTHVSPSRLSGPTSPSFPAIPISIVLVTPPASP